MQIKLEELRSTVKKKEIRNANDAERNATMQCRLHKTLQTSVCYSAYPRCHVLSLTYQRNRRRVPTTVDRSSLLAAPQFHLSKMSQSSLSGSSTCDNGRDIYEELGRYRQKTLERAEQIKTTIQLDKSRAERAMYEMRRTCDSLPPMPEEPDDTAGMRDQRLAECFQTAKVCKVQGELYEAVLTCKLFRQRAQTLAAEAVELTRLAEQAAETDSDDEAGSVRASGDSRE